MRGWIAVAAVMVVGVPPASAQPAAEVDVASVRDRFVVFTDGKGRHLVAVAIDPDPPEPASSADADKDRDATAQAGKLVFFGDGKDLHQIGSSHRAERVEREGHKVARYWFWDARLSINSGWGLVDVDGDAALVSCREGPPVRFTRLAPDQARALLDRSRMVGPRFAHRAFALARDDAGIYYYADRVGQTMWFRLFIGRRARMKPVKLIDSVYDSEGTLLVTGKGSLSIRWIGKAEKAEWIAGKTRTELVLVPVHDVNRRLMYSELGVYDGLRFGTPCDHY